MADERLIVALDVHTEADVKRLVEQLGDSVNHYKVGMELFYSIGYDIVLWLTKFKHKKVFLDLKLHDIPNTTAMGLSSLIEQGAGMLNIHAGGGFTMMKTAAERIKIEAERQNIERPKLIAVTILTSINEEDWKGLGYQCSIREQVLRLAELAKKAGLDGVVASPQEAEAIREACGEEFLIVTPGVRPAGAAINDQSRIATPAQAFKNGASHIVVGRPIIAAEDPFKAATAILEEIHSIR